MSFNQEVAEIFSRMADFLEIRDKDDDVFRIRAYRGVALMILGINEDLSKYRVDELKKISGVGEAIAEKINEFKRTGKIGAFEKLKKSFPAGISKMLDIPGLGPKHAKLLWKQLGVTTVAQLKKALVSGKVATLAGFGEKSAQKLLIAIHSFTSVDRIPREKVLPVARTVLRALKKLLCVKEALPAGSLRRERKTVHDIDILVSSKYPKKCAREIASCSFWENMIGRGETKVSGLVKGIQCDIRIVAPKSFGAAAIYFTGSKGFNIYLRKIAISKGLKLNEYGLFDKNGIMVAGDTEKGVLSALNLTYLEPKERDQF